ncbi:MarR family transcriptional regulator [Candidatus Woesearchaeota archaeon]|nr:MarR family transcriptional regulator [Candidatus Woesearchaeota archaeon]
MGQQEVYDFLQTNPDDWFTSKEISDRLKISIGSVTNNLAKLRKRKEIAFKTTGNRNEYRYSFKR